MTTFLRGRKSSHKDETRQCNADDELNHAQREMIRRLKETQASRSTHKGLRNCSKTECGLTTCSSACRYGEWRGYQANRKKIHSLLGRAPQPLLEVNVTRASWSRKFGQLNGVSLRAAEQLVRRALDSFYDPDILAVGMIKLFAYPSRGGDWVGEVHLIVAGADKDKLEKAFRAKPYRGALLQVVSVRHVQDLRASLPEIFRSDPCVWEHPRFKQEAPERAKKSQRAEYYAWLAGLATNARLIRYGSDRYFNKLKKPIRTRPSERKKKRPYPYWLGPFQFGPNRSGQE